LHADFDSAVSEMTRMNRLFEPDPRAHQVYSALYLRVYQKMYDRLKPLYKEIQAITGYGGSAQ